ncbi:hypothetical protein SAMN06296386_102321 [Lachnospiraceae bacterium]|nr:hypothetical protein SAMN06296386_102321 [Lachnospiraceae bacterium]
MNDKTCKWVCAGLCLLSIIFGVINIYKEITFLIDFITFQLGIRSFVIGSIICTLFLILSIFLLIIVFRGSYQRTRLVYGGLAAVGALFFVTEAWDIMEGSYFLDSLARVFSGLLIASIAICLIVSLKKWQKLWLAVIIAQLMVLSMFVGVSRATLQCLSILIAGLIINVRLSKTAKYDNATSAFESLKMQYEAGKISEEEYAQKKAELISQI